jgi:phospholipase/carboxylesterase
MQVQSLNGFEYIVQGRLDGPIAPLLLLHKTGGDERELLPLAERVAPGHPLIAVRGPVLEEGKRRFFRRISAGIFDEEDLRFRAYDLGDFLEAIAARHGSRPPLALGLSNGANIAAGLLLLRPGVLAGAALLRPACPFAILPNNDLALVPVLVVAGTEDAMVPTSETDRLVKHFASNGAALKRRDIEAGHRLTDGDAPIIRSWLTPHATQLREAL